MSTILLFPKTKPWHNLARKYPYMRDSAESDKRQRDIAGLMSIVDTMESETIRSSLQKLVDDPENTKRRYTEERRFDLEQSLNRTPRNPIHEDGFVRTCLDEDLGGQRLRGLGLGTLNWIT